MAVNDRNHDARPLARVSIAHDRYIAAVAISQYGDIGIDLQADYPLESCHRIAETWFPDLESEEILASENCDRFLLSWVIKEASAKCMNRSIFETCRAISVWQGKVYITGGAAGVPQFAWLRQKFGVNNQLAEALSSAAPGVTCLGFCGTGFAMGICLMGKAPSTPDIECLIPGPNSELRHCVVDWEWIPVAG